MTTDMTDTEPNDGCHRPAGAGPVQHSVGPLRAALRDASWFRCPSTHGKNLVYHVVRSDVRAEEGACGIPVIGLEVYPRRDVTVAAEAVAPKHRCQRPGCRARWPEWPNGANNRIDPAR